MDAYLSLSPRAQIVQHAAEEDKLQISVASGPCLLSSLRKDPSKPAPRCESAVDARQTCAKAVRT